MATLFPQAVGDTRPLPRRAACALGRGSLARAVSDEVRGPRSPVEFRAA